MQIHESLGLPKILVDTRMPRIRQEGHQEARASVQSSSPDSVAELQLSL